MISSKFIQNCYKLPKLAVVWSYIGQGDLLDLLIV